MTDLVDPDQIEDIVGARRHPTRHIGRAISAEQTVYILHSAVCKAGRDDLRRCTYSRALDLGIHETAWRGWQDRPVVLGFSHSMRLVPLRDASEAERAAKHRARAGS